MSELAVTGCTFKASLETGVGTISALMSTMTPPSDFVLAENKGVYFDKITVILGTGSTVTVTPEHLPSGATSPTGTLTAIDTIDINGTASDIESEGKPAVQKGDSGEKLVTFTFPSSGSGGVPGTFKVTVEVEDAGQSSVVAY